MVDLHSRVVRCPSPPMPLIQLALLVVVFLFTAGLQNPAPDEPPPFDQWLQELMAEARTRDFSEELIQEALADLEPRPQVIANDSIAG